MKDTPWDRALEVTGDGSGLVGHAGGILLRKLADGCGLTAALKEALSLKGTFPRLSRGIADPLLPVHYRRRSGGE